MIKTLSIGVLGVSAIPALAIPALLLGTPSPTGAASSEAFADIPAPLVDAYWDAAATCPGLTGPVLAAIGKVESDHGRMGGASMDATGRVTPPIVGPRLDGSGGTQRVVDTDGAALDGDAVFDRAVGPMQFLPSTWRDHGADGNGDGVADPHNAFDAIPAAAAYLCGPDGRIDDLEAALLSYNRSRAYLAEVLIVAARYAEPAHAFITADAHQLVVHPNVRIGDTAHADLTNGAVDPRVVAMLTVLADRYEIQIGVVRTGHSQCVGGGSRADRPGCTVSNHWYGRGVDIPSVAGRPVSIYNAAALRAVEFLLALPPDLRPDEIGGPWPALSHLPGVFSDADHRSHLHLAYESPPRP